MREMGALCLQRLVIIGMEIGTHCSIHVPLERDRKESKSWRYTVLHIMLICYCNSSFLMFQLLWMNTAIRRSVSLLQNTGRTSQVYSLCYKVWHVMKVTWVMTFHIVHVAQTKTFVQITKQNCKGKAAVVKVSPMLDSLRSVLSSLAMYSMKLTCVYLYSVAQTANKHLLLLNLNLTF